MLRERPEADHDRHVHAGDEHGQRPVDQGLVDDDVDVVEVVPEDRRCPIAIGTSATEPVVTAFSSWSPRYCPDRGYS
jgi:hypothetical protein